MAGLPKKYASMGFAKGWAAFRKALKQRSAHKRIVKSQAKAKPPKGIKLLSPTGPKRKGSGMKISKEKLAALKSRASRAVSKARNSAVFKDHGDAAMAIGLGAAGGVASSFAIGMIPLPASLPKPGAIKSAAQAAVGVVLAMQKNKMVKYAGYGMAVLGTVGVARDLFNVPSFAGEVDSAMYGELLQGDDEFMGDGDGDFMGAPLGAPLGASYDPFAS